MIIDDLRAPLGRPTAEDLEEAAKLVLGEANEATLGDDGAKVFRSTTGTPFLQGPNEFAGELAAAAAPELQDRLMSEAARIRKAEAEREAADYTDTAKNEMIRTD
jgi:hypothetical protein